MIGPSSQQKVDPLHTAAAETQRLISVQDELTIAGLCAGIDNHGIRAQVEGFARRP